MIDPTQIQYYIKTPNGTLGPYSSRTAAEIALTMQSLSDQAQCIIESKTADGKSILLG